MIKLDKFALMGAFVLTGALGFTACSSDDIADVEPNPTFDGESVKTQFAINIPYAKGGTRMSSGTVQQNNNFRGMQDIYLVSTTGSSANDFSYITGLDNITALDNSGSGNNGNYKLYSDVNIPTGTKYFHFYGQALKNGTPTNMENGVIETNLTTAASRDAIEFKLRTINSDNTTTTFSNGMKKMVDYLNAVATAFGTPTDPSELKTLYDEFIKMKAASANSLLIAMQTLYDNLPSTGADAVKTAILGESNSVMSVNGSGKLSWNTTNYAANFPENVGLPEGVAMVEWNSGESKFVQAVLGGNSYTVGAAKICYPAALYYYIGTNAKTLATEYADWSTNMGTATAWDGYDWTTNGWGDEVTATTRTVALEDNVQYAVGNLKTTVRCTAGSLPDNADELGTQGNVNYVPVGDGFPVTAIIVGGQPDKVGYDFTGGTTFDYNIYDKFPADYKAANVTSAPSTANYTLVLDNSKDDNTNKTVYFALELTNNSGINFYGHDGLIANGMKFYLIGELDPIKATFSGDTGAKPTNVFTKDYVTTANVKISSLADAYVTIPDLRAERLSLGLSVDLEWQTGLVFDVEIK